MNVLQAVRDDIDGTNHVGTAEEAGEPNEIAVAHFLLGC